LRSAKFEAAAVLTSQNNLEFQRIFAIGFRAFVLFGTLFFSLAGGAPAADVPHAYLAAAMAAMGGEAKLRAIEAIEYRAVGTRMMVEQSERPSGPFVFDHFRVHEIRDLSRARTRIELTEEAYAADKWWLDQPEQPVRTVIINDDVSALMAAGKSAFAGGYYEQNNEEQFAFAPERLLLTAAAAADLRAQPDVVLHGVRHHVVSFSWKGAPCTLTISASTNLPWSIRWTRAYPYQTFLNAWGDVTSSITYNAWTFEPYGISYPREWTYVRVRLPDTQLAIVSLKINPALSDADLTVPADIYAAHHGKLRRVNAVPLGLAGSGKPHEIAPGILFYPGGWNVAFVKQGAGTIVIEAPWSTGYTQRAFDAAAKWSGRPVSAVITTSDSWPHIAGVRQAVARGIPVYALDLNVPILTRLVRAPHRQIPDLLAEHPVAPKFRVVGGDTFVGSGDDRLEIVPYRTTTGERQMMIYFPARRLLYTSDLFSGDGAGGWFTPQYLREMIGVVRREHLAVDTIWGMHYDPTPFHVVVEYLARFVSPPVATAAPVPTQTPQPAATTDAAAQNGTLAYFVGSWRCDGSFPASGKTISSTMRFERDLGGTAILKHHDDIPPAGYHAVETWAYSPSDHHFNNGIADNFGGLRRFASDGWNGTTLTWTSAPEVTPKQQFVYVRVTDSEMRVDWQVARDGTNYVVGDTLTCKRAGS